MILTLEFYRQQCKRNKEMSKTSIIVEQFISYNISNHYNVLSQTSVFAKSYFIFVLYVELSSLSHADSSTVQ